MGRQLLAGWLLLLPMSGLACEVGRIESVPATFRSHESALAEVTRRHARDWRLSDTEYVGVIYDLGGRYRIDVGPGCPGAHAFTLRVRPPAGAVIAAFWHSHGAPGPHRHLFSAEDAAVVASTGVPLYLITPGDVLSVLTPEHLRTRKPALLRSSGSRLRQRGYAGDRVQRLTSAINR